MAVGDVPDTPAASLVVVILLADLDGEQALLAGVAFPSVAVDVVAVAGIPDQVCWFDAQWLVAHEISLQGQRGI